MAAARAPAHAPSGPSSARTAWPSAARSPTRSHSSATTGRCGKRCSARRMAREASEMLPKREGRFRATIGEHAVDETGPNRLATFICQFRLTQELVNGQWDPIDEDWWITG